MRFEGSAPTQTQDVQATLPPSHRFDVAAFQSLLETNAIGRYLVYRERTDTTMRLALEQGEDGAPQGTLILAERQTSGVGRVEGRKWHSAGDNLYFTIVFWLSDEDAYKLPLISAIAIASACRREGVNAWIKWPNDIWVGSKKVSGLLINTAIGKARPDTFQQLGIGINVNEDFENHESEEIRQRARSLRDFLKEHVSREQILAHVCNRLEKLLELPMKEILEEYMKYEKLARREVIVMPNKEEDLKREQGKAVGYSEKGLLIVTINEQARMLSAEEVSVSLKSIEDLEDEPLIKRPDIAKVITGDWENQLGSKVTFEAIATDSQHPENGGSLNGEYQTAVGNVVKKHPLRGTWCAVRRDDEGAMMSFSVTWVNMKPGTSGRRSTTAWSARLYILPDPQYAEIHSTWTLTAERPRKSCLRTA